MAGIRCRNVALVAVFTICIIYLPQVKCQPPPPPSVVDCVPNPCQNGGTCLSLFIIRLCLCRDGYRGDNCELAICGTNPAAPPSPRYFGESDAPLGKWPWQGYIRNIRGLNYGATLISDQWAVTSAGNVDILSTPSNIDSLVFGDIYQGEGTVSDYRQVAFVEEIVRHPGANLHRTDGDAVLLKFTEPLKIDDYVRPICLPPNETVYYDVCYTTGWGLDEMYVEVDYLKEGRATIVDLETCIDFAISINSTTLPSENVICSQQVDTSEGPCLGDGGNALACYRDGMWDMVGVNAGGWECGGELPSVSWKTSAFLDFINHVAFEDPEMPEFCEPISVEECAPSLPYDETYANQQDQVPYMVNLYLDIGRKTPDCDLGVLQELLCGLFLSQCEPGDEGQQVVCRGYCQSLVDLCRLPSDAGLCWDLPYGSDISEKWCIKGEDYSCGDQIMLEPGIPSPLVSPLYPGTYPELRDCLWTITVPEGFVINTKFLYLDIYPDGDALTYGVGDSDLLTSVVCRVDGSVTPPIWRSRFNELWIRFQSNIGPQVGYGFWINISQQPQEGRPCGETDFICDGYCHPEHIVCDFVGDCSDGSDELGCNDVLISEQSAIVESPPLWPSYPPNFNYTWNLEVPEGYLIGLDFEDFDLDVGGGDYLVIGEGRDGETEDALYSLAGNRRPFRILPFASDVWLRLVTDDERGGGRGFRVNATRELDVPEECDSLSEFDCGNGLCLNREEVCDGIVQCASGTDEEDCQAECSDGTAIPREELCNQEYFCYEGEDEEGCDLAKLGDMFYFEVPRDPYNPDDYVSNTTLAWIIRAEEGLGFAVEFVEFSVEPEFDVLYLGSKPNDLEGLEQVTGRFPQQPRFIENNTLFAVFKSDENKNYGEVTLGVEVVEVRDTGTCEKGNYLHSSQICDGLWHCPDGRDEVDCDPLPLYRELSVATPGYPYPYENNAAVMWTFEAEENATILFFPYFFNSEESYDTLRIGSGSECRENYFAELSGYADPTAIISEDNTLCLFFSSDETITADGLTGGVLPVQDEDYVQCPEDGVIIFRSLLCDFYWDCRETGTDEMDCPVISEGVFPLTSVNYPSPYRPNYQRLATSTRAEGTVLLIEFTDFDLGEGDYWRIGCGFGPDDPSSTVVAEFTGSELPGPLIVECLSAWRQFESDGDQEGYGYNGTITVVNSSDLVWCPENEEVVVPSKVCDTVWDCLETGYDESDCPVLGEGVFPLTSPNYPGPYPNNSRTVETGTRMEGLVLTVEFNEFDLEEGDILSIGCGFDPRDPSSYAVATLTGNEIPETVVIEECLTVYVQFESDGMGSGNGYDATLRILNPTDLVRCPENEEVVAPSKVCDTFWDCLETGYDESDCPVLGLGVFTLTSPNYPAPYPNNSRTVETGTRMDGLVLTVEFHEFDLAEGDILSIGCGFDPRDPSSFAVATLTGNEIPETVVIEECLTVYVQFESDGMESGNGYIATLKTGHCAGVLPYSAFGNESSVATLLLHRETLSGLLVNQCFVENIQRAACFLLYPPADEDSYPYAPCPGTCNAFGSCPLVNVLLIDVDCSDYDGYNQMADGNPGLCMI